MINKRSWTEKRMKIFAYAVATDACEDFEVPYELKKHTLEEDKKDANDLRMTLNEYKRYKEIVKEEYLHLTGKTEI